MSVQLEFFHPEESIDSPSRSSDIRLVQILGADKAHCFWCFFRK